MKGGTGVIGQASDAASIDLPRTPHLLARAKWPLLALLASLLIWTTLAIDVSVEQYFLSIKPRGFVRDLLKVAEVFGNGFGVVLVLVVVIVLDNSRKASALRLAWCSLGAGLMADVIKLFISRARPYAANMDIAAWESFGPLAPFMAGGPAAQSFPSAHTATAAGLAVGLAMLYPRGRYLFVTLTVGVALQRMVMGVHFPSDVLIGAAVGATWASYCLPGTALGNWIGRWEEWLANKVKSSSEEEMPATLKFPANDAELPETDRETHEAA